MNDSDGFIKKRLLELAQRAYTRDMQSFSCFLSLHEQALLLSLNKQLPPIPFHLFGGNANCERKMAGFSGSLSPLCDSSFPISCLCARPLNESFCDALTHRDFLGALMNLGIERDTIGDIMLSANQGYVFCQNGIVPFLLENLKKAKHTSLRCSLVSSIPLCALPTRKTERIQCAGERVDALIAKAYHLSRETSQMLFPQGKVFINGAPCARCGDTPETGDIISVRGYGRFYYKGISGYSKKGKLNIEIEKYESDWTQ